ncbi:glycosyltransferase family 4 protein [soil metagenome]
MKRKKVALYDPYLDTMGGGERHILSILKVLDDMEFDIDIFWHEDLYDQIQSKLNITFNTKPQFINTWATSKAINRFQMLGQYDIFLYVTDGSYFFSSAKKNFVFCMVPLKSLYNMSSLNVLKIWNYSFISNSRFTQKYLKDWELPSNVMYPYIDQSFITDPLPDGKKPVILSVGRFFQHLHSKRQDIAIEWFKVLKKEYSEYKDYTLVLAGSLMPEDAEYMSVLQSLAEGREDIIFKTDISFLEIKKLYEDAQFYWHFAGWEVDDKAHPEAVEHLGITPLEAMSRGCITCAYNIGGPAEIIQNQTTGILFNDQQALFKNMRDIMKNKSKQTNLHQAAKEYVAKNFSYNVFKKRVEKLLLSEK